MRAERCTVRKENVAMNQVLADIASKHISVIFLGPSISVVNRTTGGSSKPAADLFRAVEFVFVIALLPKTGSLFAPFLRMREGKQAGGRAAVIGYVLRLGRNLEQGRTREILHRKDDVADMRRILRD